MLKLKVITPLLVLFLLLSSLLAQEQESITKKAATELCLEQTIRCSEDGGRAQVCVKGEWLDKIFCKYGCEKGHCLTKTIEGDQQNQEQPKVQEQLEETLEKKIQEQPEETAEKKEKLRERILGIFKNNKEDKKNKEDPSLNLGKDLEPKMTDIYNLKEKEVEESTSKLKIPKIHPEEYFSEIFPVEDIKRISKLKGKKPERDEGEEEDEEIIPLDEEPPEISDRVIINPSREMAGTIFTIRVPIADDQSSILATATISKEEETHLILLYDDGLHNDADADDTKFGGVWDSTGASVGIYDVTITARDESGNEATLTGNQINIIETLPCYELLPGHNNLDESRVNVVFVFVNYNPSEPTDRSPEQFARFMLDGSPVSLAMTEPFRSNLDAFNFLYVDGIGTVDTYETGWEVRGYEAQETIMELAAGCLVPNKYVIAYIGWDFRPNANFGGTSRVSLGPPELLTDTMSNLESFARLTAHEFGHSFGFLLDEYIEEGILEETQDNNQCYYSPLVACREEIDLRTIDGEVERETIIVVCESTPASQEECEANANWRDLIGNGCGEDGVVDCPPPICIKVDGISTCTEANENYPLEESCIQIGCRTVQNLHVHSFNTIMRNQDANPFSYGPVNERTLCRRIREVSGIAGGICENLCIDGCTEGQRCIRGGCTDV